MESTSSKTTSTTTGSLVRPVVHSVLRNDSGRVEKIVGPFDHPFVIFVLGISHRFEKVGVSASAGDVVGRTGILAVETA